METIGENIIEMQEMINTILDPAPSWVRKWQMEAEHVLFLAGSAREAEDYDRLRMLDEEAKRLVETRRTRLESR